jgi:hypothetical protein
MGKITNKFGLPATLVRFLERDTYSRGASRMSVTQLIDAPRVVQLRSRHDSEVEEDVSSQLWLILGKALHHVLEHGTNRPDGSTTEERFFATVDGWSISGQVDLQEVHDQVQGEHWDGPRHILSDWKFTSVWSVMADKASWTNQLNVYRWLAEQNGKKITGLQVVAFLRDWDARDAQKQENILRGYPPAPMKVVPIKMWDYADVDTYVRDRVKRHQLAAIEAEMGVEPPLCSAEERWEQPAKWVVQRPGIEKPARVLNTEEEAKAWIASKGDYALVVKKRVKPPARCLGGWCRVSKWCSQWQEEQREQQGPEPTAAQE